MIRNVLALGFVGLLATAAAGGEALADPDGAEMRPAWGNQAGWTYLGETRVGGFRGRNVLEVERGMRRLDRIMLVGRDGADVRAVRVFLADGDSFVARVGDFGGRAVVDLPDRGRVTAIEVFGGRQGWGRRWGGAVQVFGDLRERHYGNGNGNGYGYDNGNGYYNHDGNGHGNGDSDYGIGGGGGGYQPASWQPLGSVSVDGRRDRETIVVGRDGGRFRQLMLTASAGVNLRDLTVTFLNGEVATLPLRAGASGSGLVVDLPGDARAIREVSFGCSQPGYYGNARVDLSAM